MYHVTSEKAQSCYAIQYILPRYFSPLFVNNGVSKMRSRKKKKKQVLSEALLLNFIDIFVVLTVDATVNYQFMTNSSSISFRN